MENFAVLCPELAFKIEYYADAADSCAAVLEVDVYKRQAVCCRMLKLPI